MSEVRFGEAWKRLLAAQRPDLIREKDQRRDRVRRDVREPDAVKVARPVPRGGGGRDAVPLPSVRHVSRCL